MNRDGMGAFFQAQRAFDDILKAMHANSFAPLLASVEAANRRVVDDYRKSVEPFANLAAVSAVNDTINQLRETTNNSVIAQLLNSFERQPIQVMLDQINANMSVLRPNIGGVLREGMAWRELSTTLASIDRSAILGSLDAIIHESPVAGIPVLNAFFDSGPLPEVVQQFERALDIVGTSNPDRRKSVRLTPAQEIWFGIVLLILIWALTRGHTADAASGELHSFAGAAVASVLAWGLVRNANDRDE